MDIDMTCTWLEISFSVVGSPQVSQRAMRLASTETVSLVGFPNPAVSPIRGKTRPLNHMAGTVRGKTRRPWACGACTV